MAWGRGVVVINQGEGKVFVSWQVLGTGSQDIAFNLYRSTGMTQHPFNTLPRVDLRAPPR